MASLGSGRAMGGDSAPSCGGSIVMFGSSLSSQRGMYHVFSPISVNSAGTVSYTHLTLPTILRV